MSWTRFGLVAGIGFLALVVIAVIVADSALRTPMLALLALVVLVAGGNWLNDWLGIKRKAQEFNRPDRAPREDEGP